MNDKNIETDNFELKSQQQIKIIYKDFMVDYIIVPDDYNSIELFRFITYVSLLPRVEKVEIID